MPANFTSRIDWECSSGPIVPRDFHVTDLWPVGAHGYSDGTAKDYLEDGLHPVVAISQTAANGTKTGRPRNLTGVVITYNEDAEIAQVNMAEKVCVKNYVSNVATYSGGAPYTYKTTFYIGMPVYVDDSTGLGAGTTLSTLNANDDGDPNPLAGYLFYCQDEYANSGIGGPNVTSTWDGGTITLANSHVEAEYCILLTNDYGTGEADLDPQG